MTTVAVTWTKSWEGAPFVDPAVCTHPGSSSMAVGLTVTRNARGRATIETKATLCMLCGTDSSGQMKPDDALEAAWLEFGWHRSTGQRIVDLTRRFDEHADEAQP